MILVNTLLKSEKYTYIFCTICGSLAVSNLIWLSLFVFIKLDSDPERMLKKVFKFHYNGRSNIKDDVQRK